MFTQHFFKGRENFGEALVSDSRPGKYVTKLKGARSTIGAVREVLILPAQSTGGAVWEVLILRAQSTGGAVREVLILRAQSTGGAVREPQLPARVNIGHVAGERYLSNALRSGLFCESGMCQS